MWVDDFLRVCMSVDVGGDECRVRSLTALENSERQWFASERAKEMLVTLKDPKSDLYEKHVALIMEKSKDRILRELLLRRKSELREEAFRVVLRDGTPEPVDDSPSAKAKASLETAKLEAEAEVRRIEWVEAALGAYVKAMSKLKVDTLRETLADQVTDALTDREFAKWSNYWTICEVVYADEEMKEKRFASPEEVAKTSSKVTDRIGAALIAINTVDGEKLKNLQSGQQSDE